jgi:hypothetical protein
VGEAYSLQHISMLSVCGVVRNIFPGSGSVTISNRS